MRLWILVVFAVMLAGGAPAQEPVNGSGKRLERLRQQREWNTGVTRRDSDDARRLDQLQRLRQRSEQRVRQLRPPQQTSRPANSSNLNQNTVRTQ